MPEPGTTWRDTRDDDIAMLMVTDAAKRRVRMRCLSSNRPGVRVGVEAWFALEAFREHWVPFEVRRPRAGDDDGR